MMVRFRIDGKVEEVAPTGGDGPGVLILDGLHRADGLCRGFVGRGWRTWRSDARLHHVEGVQLVVSFGYRHIIPEEVIEACSAPILNLHISYLPFNRGRHPGFWCFKDGTPCGVSVHVIDGGLDTGPLLGRRIVEVDPWRATFEAVYWRLREEVEDLFWEVLPPFLTGDLRPIPQLGPGTLHRAADLPEEFAGWTATIGPEIARLADIEAKRTERSLDLIGEILDLRRSNEAELMDLLGSCLLDRPQSGHRALEQVRSNDRRTADLLERLGRELRSGGSA